MNDTRMSIFPGSAEHGLGIWLRAVCSCTQIGPNPGSPRRPLWARGGRAGIRMGCLRCRSGDEAVRTHAAQFRQYAAMGRQPGPTSCRRGRKSVGPGPHKIKPGRAQALRKKTVTAQSVQFYKESVSAWKFNSQDL